MKKFLALFICFLLLTAAKKPEPELSPEIVLSEKECEDFLNYQPVEGVEYEPGVDVHGRPVMEADITPSVIRPPEKYSFDITVDVAKYMGLTVPQGVEGKAKIGTIELENGKATFNGNPLEGDEEATLRAICLAQKAERQKKEAAPPPPKKIDRK